MFLILKTKIYAAQCTLHVSTLNCSLSIFISQTARRREHAHQNVLLPLMAAAPAFFHRPGGTGAAGTVAAGLSASLDGGSRGGAVDGMHDDGGGEGAALLLRRFVFPCVLPAALNASPLAATAADFGDWRLWPESVLEHQSFASSSSSSSSSGESHSFGSDASSAAASVATATGGASLVDLSAVLFRRYSSLLRIELGSLLIDLWLPMLAAPACPAAHRVELLGALGMRLGLSRVRRAISGSVIVHQTEIANHGYAEFASLPSKRNSGRLSAGSDA